MISLAIPTLNRANFLQQLLNSISIQTSKNFEVCISDNASEDSTEEIVKQFTIENPEILVKYYKHHQRLPFDRNLAAAARLATKPFLWIMGDDDRIDSNAIECLNSYLRATNYSTLLLNYRDWNYEFSKCLKTRFFQNKTDNLVATQSDLIEISGFFFSFMSCHVVRADLWDKYAVEKAFELQDSIHMLVPLMAATQGQNGYLATPLFDKRSSRLDMEYYDSIDIVPSWHQSINSLIEHGVSKKTCDLFFKEYINDWHCSRDVLGKKLRNSKYYLSNRKYLATHYSRFPQYWFKVWPIFWTPVWILKALKKVKAASSSSSKANCTALVF